MRPTPPPPPMTASAASTMTDWHRDAVDQVRAALAAHDLVVVGMGINPHPRRVCRALDEAGLPYHYLAFGSYFSGWRPRLAIKLWSGWPTFPQVFARGTLVGGADQTIAALADGSLRRLLEGEPADQAVAT